MSGSSNKQTTTQTNQPYAAAKPLLNQGMGDALSLYKSGNLVKPNTMSTVVPFARQTMTGLSGLQNLANANSGARGLTGQMQGVINRGGFTPDQSSAVAGIRRTAGGNGYNAEQLAALNGIRQTATGNFNINANPAFANVRQRAMDAAGDAANSTAAGLGRYASGTHQGVLAREVGNVAADLDFNEYQNWQQRRDAAQRDLFGMGQIGQGNVSNAQDRLFNAGQTGMDNMAGAFETAQAPGQLNMHVGGAFEDLMGRQMNDQLRIANELQNLPLANIQALLGVSSGAGNFGTQTQTAQGPNNSFSNILGAGLGGLSLLGSL